MAAVTSERGSGMTEPVKKGRVFYKTKAAWATAMADEKRILAAELKFESMAGKSEAVKRDKWRKVRQAEGEARKFEQLAAKYAAAGQ